MSTSDLGYEKIQKCADSLKEGDNLSYWKGDTSEPLINLTIGQMIEETANLYPNRTAISYFGGQKLTYLEVLDKIDTLAASLIELGLGKGNHLGIWGLNTVEWCLSFLGAQRAGIVVVNLNPFQKALELSACLKKGDVNALIMDEKLNDSYFYDTLKSVLPELESEKSNSHISSEHIPLLKTVIIISDEIYKGTFKWSDLLLNVTKDQKQKIRDNQSHTLASDICNLQFTSGTTSQPKGVLLTHRHIVNNAHFNGKLNGIQKKEHKICVPTPFFHALGEVVGMISTLKFGCNLIIPNKHFSPNRLLDCIIQEKCTVVIGTPTMYIDLLTVSIDRQLTDAKIFDKMSCIEFLVTGGASLLPEVFTKLSKYIRTAKIIPGYGMTETSPVTFLSFGGDPSEVRQTYIGRVLDHTEVKVVDKNGQLVPFGTPGEMCFKGYMVMKGYYKDPEKTRSVLTEDGWLHSGDRFILTENGYGQIVGRIKDLIIRGGENVEPKEVEEIIIKHPEVIDVQVYGVSDPRLGEAVAAAILKIKDSKLREEDIKSICQEKVASFKIPQYVTFLDEFPKTASGKVQKFLLKEITEKQFNL